ncbi:hypothetical protein C7M84_012923 [Penaeus vannamei]|uniref:Uncharacterized protein n=1 Tax=Penaeus vannamei TaxID=6689 RepID=A0A423SXY7_PENVA|nr:hypothetical protein C7M84_012923 [Penaeus vannamei]
MRACRPRDLGNYAKKSPYMAARRPYPAPLNLKTSRTLPPQQAFPNFHYFPLFSLLTSIIFPRDIIIAGILALGVVTINIRRHIRRHFAFVRVISLSFAASSEAITTSSLAAWRVTTSSTSDGVRIHQPPKGSRPLSPRPERSHPPNAPPPRRIASPSSEGPAAPSGCHSLPFPSLPFSVFVSLHFPSPSSVSPILPPFFCFVSLFCHLSIPFSFSSLSPSLLSHLSSSPPLLRPDLASYGLLAVAIGTHSAPFPWSYGRKLWVADTKRRGDGWTKTEKKREKMQQNQMEVMLTHKPTPSFRHLQQERNFPHRSTTKTSPHRSNRNGTPIALQRDVPPSLYNKDVPIALALQPTPPSLYNEDVPRNVPSLYTTKYA